jgi:hypothetical protein
MATRTVDKGGDRQRKPMQSEWSPEVVHTIRVPGNLFVNVLPTSPDALDVKWELPPADRNWNFGSDVTYRLKQRGNCPEDTQSRPITKNNVVVSD